MLSVLGRNWHTTVPEAITTLRWGLPRVATDSLSAAVPSTPRTRCSVPSWSHLPSQGSAWWASVQACILVHRVSNRATPDSPPKKEEICASSSAAMVPEPFTFFSSSTRAIFTTAPRISSGRRPTPCILTYTALISAPPPSSVGLDPTATAQSRRASRLFLCSVGARCSTTQRAASAAVWSRLSPPAGRSARVAVAVSARVGVITRSCRLWATPLRSSFSAARTCSSSTPATAVGGMVCRATTTAPSGSRPSMTRAGGSAASPDSKEGDTVRALLRARKAATELPFFTALQWSTTTTPMLPLLATSDPSTASRNPLHSTAPSPSLAFTTSIPYSPLVTTVGPSVSSSVRDTPARTREAKQDDCSDMPARESLAWTLVRRRRAAARTGAAIAPARANKCTSRD
mmetsp:Transcript_59780/g.138192  ORF Transcript_59780/g.138192 Transcript_59780/m.138192 type:complete len:402 (-) Transcript_59780:5893-7098(-)